MSVMKRSVIGLATLAALSVGSLSPAFADIAECSKFPNADTCPTFGEPTLLVATGRSVSIPLGSSAASKPAIEAKAIQGDEGKSVPAIKSGLGYSAASNPAQEARAIQGDEGK
jgi:hypothetical protein